MGKYAHEKAPLRSELFSAEQMEQYAKTLAGRHVLFTGRQPEQLLKRLADNEELLLEVHDLLTESAKKQSYFPGRRMAARQFLSYRRTYLYGQKTFAKGL